MGNNLSIPSLESFNKSKELALEEFQKQTPRKMTIHLLSSKLEDCIEFIETFTNEKIGKKNELLEKNIETKINLYSFMNYKIYKDASKLMEEIENKVKINHQDPKANIFSEVLIILDNDDIENQICTINNKFNERIIKNNAHLNPFLILISPKKLNKNGFIKKKTVQYYITWELFQRKKKRKRK